MGLHQPHIKKRIYKIILCHCVDVAHQKSTEILTQVPGMTKKALVQIKLCVCGGEAGAWEKRTQYMVRFCHDLKSRQKTGSTVCSGTGKHSCL